MSATRDQRPGQRTRESIQKTMQRSVMGLHSLLYRLSGGTIGGRLFNSPVLLLTTIGRKTGKLRVTPLLYLPDGSTMVIVASNGGALKDPVWWLNLQKQPLALVQVGRQRLDVCAEQATREQHVRLWPLLIQMYPPFADYQRRTDRPIPVIILTPIVDTSSAR